MPIDLEWIREWRSGVASCDGELALAQALGYISTLIAEVERLTITPTPNDGGVLLRCWPKSDASLPSPLRLFHFLVDQACVRAGWSYESTSVPQTQAECVSTLRKLGFFTRGELVDLPRWIPVTERLPEVGVYVLIVRHAHYVECGVLTENGWGWSSGRLFDAVAERMTHWQPLPGPPLTREERARRTTAALDDIMAAGPYKPLPEPPK